MFNPIQNLLKANHENRLDERLKHKNFGEWQDIFQDNTTSAAILDRILHHSKVVKIVGESYRLKERADFLTPYTTKAPDVAPMPLIIYIHLSLQTGILGKS